MELNLKTLTTEQIDQMIVALGRERASRPEKFPEEPSGEQIDVTSSPAWRGQMINGAVIIRMLSGYFGWVNFGLNKAEASNLLTYLMAVVIGGHFDVATSATLPPGSSTKH